MSRTRGRAGARVLAERRRRDEVDGSSSVIGSRKVVATGRTPPKAWEPARRLSSDGSSLRLTMAMALWMSSQATEVTTPPTSTPSRITGAARRPPPAGSRAAIAATANAAATVTTANMWSPCRRPRRRPATRSQGAPPRGGRPGRRPGARRPRGGPRRWHRRGRRSRWRGDQQQQDDAEAQGIDVHHAPGRPQQQQGGRATRCPRRGSSRAGLTPKTCWMPHRRNGDRVVVGGCSASYW